MNQLKLSAEMPDLEEIKKPKSEIQRRKNAINFRKSDTDKSCKLCTHTTYTEIVEVNGLQVVYGFRCRKCPYIGFSKGEATDIKKGYICDLFKQKEES